MTNVYSVGFPIVIFIFLSSSIESELDEDVPLVPLEDFRSCTKTDVTDDVGRTSVPSSFFVSPNPIDPVTASTDLRYSLSTTIARKREKKSRV